MSGREPDCQPPVIERQHRYHTGGLERRGRAGGRAPGGGDLGSGRLSTSARLRAEFERPVGTRRVVRPRNGELGDRPTRAVEPHRGSERIRESCALRLEGIRENHRDRAGQADAVRGYETGRGRGRPGRRGLIGRRRRGAGPADRRHHRRERHPHRTRGPHGPAQGPATTNGLPPSFALSRPAAAWASARVANSPALTL